MFILQRHRKNDPIDGCSENESQIHNKIWFICMQLQVEGWSNNEIKFRISNKPHFFYFDIVELG